MVVMGWSWTSSVRTNQLLLIGAVVGMIAVLVAGVSLLSAVLPDKRGAVQLRNPVPLDEEFANLNRVSHWPADWINAVCEPPLYQLRNYARLPHATSNASCRSLIEPGGDVDYLMIARFPSELPMQVDLHNQGYEWYAFTFDNGSMVSFETVSDTTVTDPATGLGESPVLQPLKQFGFNTYSDPGPP
ncbi:MAG: hypothetical protein QOI25_1017 [Mycobacterium sp.]|jgi:hypothetical protein|nr:hypothetical protein [Mycobacterium sp.]